MTTNYIIIQIILFLSFTFMTILNKDTLFSVYIGEKNCKNNDVRFLKQDYYLKNLFLFIILCIIPFVFLINSNIFFSFILFTSLFFYYGLYSIFNKKAKIIKNNLNIEEKNSIVYVDTEIRNNGLTVPSKWFLLHFGIIFLIISFLFGYYDSLPNLISSNYNIENGAITFYSYYEKDFFLISVFLLLFTISFVFIIANKYFGKKPIGFNSKLDEVQIKKIMKTQFNISTATYLFSLLLLFYFIYFLVFIPITENTNYYGVINIIFFTLFIIYIFVVVSLGNTISKFLKDSYENDEWIFGLLYFNKNNPNIFVPKPNDVGTTFNFASITIWVFYLLILSPFIIIYCIEKIGMTLFLPLFSEIILLICINLFVLRKNTHAFGFYIGIENSENHEILDMKRKFILSTIILNIVFMILTVFFMRYDFLNIPILISLELFFYFFIYNIFYEKTFYLRQHLKVDIDEYSNLDLIVESGYKHGIPTYWYLYQLLAYIIIYCIYYFAFDIFDEYYFDIYFNLFLIGTMAFSNYFINLDDTRRILETDEELKLFCKLKYEITLMLYIYSLIVFAFGISFILFSSFTIISTIFLVIGTFWFVWKEYMLSSDLRNKIKFKKYSEHGIWKFGIFYCDFDDPNILIVRKNERELSFNYANKLSWLFPISIAATIILPIFLIVLGVE